MNTACIILNYNNFNETKNCIESLESQNKKPFIIIVDNNSKDGSGEELEKYFPNYVFLKNKKNLGYTGGNNLGIKYALKNNFKYILILNNDTIIKDNNLINKIEKTFEINPKIGIIGLSIINRDTNKLYYDFTKLKGFYKVLSYFIKTFDPNNIQNELKKYYSLYVSGSAFAISSECINKTGYFDERFFMYLEEIDMCIKAHNNNYFVIYSNDIKIYRKIDNKSTYSYVWYYQSRNMFYLIRNNFKGFYRIIFFVLSMLVILK
jgi:hypothetical protein